MRIRLAQSFAADVVLIVLAWALVSCRFLTGDSFIPWDSISVFYPQAHFVADALRHGQAPWWNPYIYGGQPVLGDPQGMIFTPQVLAGILTGGRFNLYIFDLTSLLLELCGGIALARYARAYAVTRTLPILAALVFIAGGVATSRLEHVTQIETYSLLPIELLAFRGICFKPTLLRTACLTFLLVISVLNANQVVFLSAFALLPFLVLHLAQSKRRPRALLALAFAGIVVLLCDLPVLSAIAEFLRLSDRSSLGIDQSGDFSFPVFNLASIVLPGLYGVASVKNGLWSPTDISQDFLYIGVVPALLVVASLLRTGRWPAIAIICWASLLFWFIFSLGLNAPLYPFLFNHVPGFSAFRRPADGAFFLNLLLALLVGVAPAPSRALPGRWPVTVLVAAALLAALGIVGALLWSYAQSQGHAADLWIVLRDLGWRLTILAAIAAALFKLGRRAPRYLAAPLVIGLTIIDLAAAGRATSLFAPKVQTSFAAQIYSGPLAAVSPADPLVPAVKFLDQNGAGGPDPDDRMEAIGGELAADMPAVFHILSTEGYNPINLSAYGDAVGAQALETEAKVFTPASPDYDSPDYRRLGLRYVLVQSFIAAHAGDFGDVGAAVSQIEARLGSARWAKRLPDQGEYQIWQLQDALPRANLVLADGSNQACAIPSFAPSRVAIQCQAPAPARLVLGDAFAPGWFACVNGLSAPVAPFQNLFRSVAVPAGASRIIFSYQPVPFLRHASCD
jgi:hypothetical protein